MGLFNPKEALQESLASMPQEFFDVYLYLIEKGVSHEAADKAAREAWASGFKKKE